MKNKLNLFIIALVVMAVAASSIVLLRHGSNAADCGSSSAGSHAYAIVISGGKASRTSLTGRLCDTITFTNKDKVAREIAFGPHEHHVPYDGVAERVLNQNQSFTITLDKTGSYHWHDHLHDEVQGYFVVSKR